MRAGKLEKAINSIVTKIDTVLMKLEKMQAHKNKRKAAMSRIIGTINENEEGRNSFITLQKWSQK